MQRKFVTKLQISLASTFMSLILAVYRSLWKFRKDNCICYGFGSLHGVLIRPITLERAFRKALKHVMVMEKWLSKNSSTLAGEIRPNLACYMSCPTHHAPGIPAFHFFLTVCQEWKYFTIRTLNFRSQLSFDFCAGPIVRDWAGINYSLRLNAPQSEILPEFPPKRSFKLLKNIRCLIRKVKRFQTLICLFNRENLCILQHRSVDDSTPLIKLPGSVLSRLYSRQSEILIKMPLKGSFKLRKSIRFLYRNVQI